ncbi:MAG: integrase [Sphaerisporangium sp.]|nr:integrase [Sphaerisporangium sp.]
MAWGEAWQDSGRVFTREDGAALHPATVSDLFARLAYEAGLPPIRLHDLRHGAATLALAAGVDMKTVSAMLRHCSQAITSDTYTSVLPEVAHEAARGDRRSGAPKDRRRGVACDCRSLLGLPRQDRHPTDSSKKSGPPGHWGSVASRRGESNP